MKRKNDVFANCHSNICAEVKYSCNQEKVITDSHKALILYSGRLESHQMNLLQSTDAYFLSISLLKLIILKLTNKFVQIYNRFLCFKRQCRRIVLTAFNNRLRRRISQASVFTLCCMAFRLGLRMRLLVPTLVLFCLAFST